MSPRSTSAMAATTSLIGSEIDRDTRITARSPSATETTVMTTTGITTEAVLGTNQPYECSTTSSAMVKLGEALLISHIITSRATTPGAVSRLRNSVLAAATIGR